MADLAWHVSLLRLLMFGFSSLYQDLPHTVAYTERILAHSTLKQVRTVVHNITLTSCQATYTWPGYLPSPHLTSLLASQASLLASHRNALLVVVASYAAAGLGPGTSQLLVYLTSRPAAPVILAVLVFWSVMVQFYGS